jgi:hypothetical protein
VEVAADSSQEWCTRSQTTSNLLYLKCTNRRAFCGATAVHAAPRRGGGVMRPVVMGALACSALAGVASAQSKALRKCKVLCTPSVTLMPAMPHATANEETLIVALE